MYNSIGRHVNEWDGLWRKYILRFPIVFVPGQYYSHSLPTNICARVDFHVGLLLLIRIIHKKVSFTRPGKFNKITNLTK